MSQAPPVLHKPSPEEAESVATSPEQRAAPAEVTPECGSHNQSCSKEVAGKMPNSRAWLLTAPRNVYFQGRLQPEMPLSICSAQSVVCGEGRAKQRCCWGIKGPRTSLGAAGFSSIWDCYFYRTSININHPSCW